MRTFLGLALLVPLHAMAIITDVSPLPPGKDSAPTPSQIALGHGNLPLPATVEKKPEQKSIKPVPAKKSDVKKKPGQESAPAPATTKRG